jgi:hypothetical protein
MPHRAIFFAALLWLTPLTVIGQERTIRVPSLLPPLQVEEGLGLCIGRRSPAGRYQYAHRRFTQWSLISAGVLFLGTSTLLTGVRLFNKGNNAKKNAAGDTLITIGVGVDLAAILPIGVAYWWWRGWR